LERALGAFQREIHPTSYTSYIPTLVANDEVAEAIAAKDG
jgi:hypothetical protein